MPVRNGEKYLPKIIEQITANAMPFDEILICDDGSTDETAQILSKYALEDERIKIISTSGIGLVASLNAGVTTAKNEWIARYDVDDDYSIHRIDSQLALISPDTVAVFSDYRFKIAGTVSAGRIPSPITPVGCLLSLTHSQQTPHPVVLYRRSAVISVGGYLEADFPAEDLGLWLRLSSKGTLRSASVVLLNYRLSKSSVSATRRIQAQDKTRRLISKHVVDWNNPNFSQAQIVDTLATYSGSGQKFQRMYLYLRNLESAKLLWGMKIEESTLLKMRKQLGWYGKLYAQIMLGIPTLLRACYRHLPFPS